ncbi:PepSY domain-containing protein [Streptomyces sp. NPDC019539]|uniref:PepSY domain-containing protein n=1 Tax=Streptomyces sp. NPDC019539 TaxID=3365063 RepID=UPI0037931CBD
MRGQRPSGRAQRRPDPGGGPGRGSRRSGGAQRARRREEHLDGRPDRRPVRMDQVAVDPHSGEITSRVDWADHPVLAKLSTLGVRAHMGTLFGPANQIVLAVIALGLSVGIVLGYRMWWQRRPTRGTAAPWWAARPRAVRGGTCPGPPWPWRCRWWSPSAGLVTAGVLGPGRCARADPPPAHRRSGGERLTPAPYRMARAWHERGPYDRGNGARGAKRGWTSESRPGSYTSTRRQRPWPKASPPSRGCRSRTPPGRDPTRGLGVLRVGTPPSWRVGLSQLEAQLMTVTKTV